MFRFPYTNLHELNLDWILEQVKKFSELIPKMENIDVNVEYAVDTANEAMTMIEQAVTVVPCDSDPVMDGTATAGELNEFSRGDHVHPSDSSKVSKTGDTMTGILKLQQTRLEIEADIADTPDTDKYKRILTVHNNNGNVIGFIEGFEKTNGAYGLSIYGYKQVNGVDYYNGIEMEVDSDESNISVSNPSAWRNALNTINKSGDTMNGNLTLLNSNNPTLSIKNPDMDSTAQSLSADEMCSINFTDGQNNVIAFVNVIESTEGTSILNVGVRKNVGGTDVDNTFSLSVDNSGVKSVTFSDVNAWRTALGIT